MLNVGSERQAIPGLYGIDRFQSCCGHSYQQQADDHRKLDHCKLDHCKFDHCKFEERGKWIS